MTVTANVDVYTG